LWRPAVLLYDTKVSEVHAAPIFRVRTSTGNITAVKASELNVTYRNRRITSEEKWHLSFIDNGDCYGKRNTEAFGVEMKWNELASSSRLRQN